jgi:hypothetical protein
LKRHSRGQQLVSYHLWILLPLLWTPCYALRNPLSGYRFTQTPWIGSLHVVLLRTQTIEFYFFFSFNARMCDSLCCQVLITVR